MGKIIKVTKKQHAYVMATEYLDKILSNNQNKRFKIGKTGQNPPEKRLENEDYKYVYGRFFALYIDKDSDLISSLEKDLIEYCFDNHRDLCDNINCGEIESTGESFNCVYVVIE